MEWNDSTASFVVIAIITESATWKVVPNWFYFAKLVALHKLFNLTILHFTSLSHLRYILNKLVTPFASMTFPSKQRQQQIMRKRIKIATNKKEYSPPNCNYTRKTCLFPFAGSFQSKSWQLNRCWRKLQGL